MMKTSLRGIVALLYVVSLLLGAPLLCAQLANTSQQLAFAGLRSVGQKGQINGVQVDPAGNIYLLVNQGDGVRLLKTDNAGGGVLAQAQLGTTGDTGIALAIDSAGNVYVTGTTTSTALVGTAGAAIQYRTDASTNSFIAKFDSGLAPVFVTFTGGSRIAASGIAVTSDAVFVTGTTYAATLPVTSNGIQQTPSFGSTQNGFVERFSSDGRTLVYATYLTGANGDTAPAAIAADATDAVYIVGETSASGYPTIAALVPEMLSNPSGFLTRMSPLGDAISFSTFIPGAGLTSIALDSTGQTLLISGSVALGQFPVDAVAMPLVPTNYQVLLRIPIDGSGVESSTLIAPATQSYVSAGANGDAWIDGVFTAPMLPLLPLSTIGSGFAVHVPAGAAIDQTARFGGLPNQSPTFASLQITITSVAVDANGGAIVAGAVQPTASSTLLASETYDLPLLNAPTPTLPSTVSDARLTTSICHGSLCAGSAAYLAKLNPQASTTALSFSMDDLPSVIVRNLGTLQVSGLQLSATGSTLTTNCPTNLFAGGECNVLLAAGAAGDITATMNNGGSQTVSFPTFAATSPKSSIVYFPKELDFGIQTATSTAATRTITVTNLGTISQTFTSVIDAASNPKLAAISPFTEVSSDCVLAGSMTLKTLTPGGTCHITLGLTAYTASSSDGFLTSNWSIGSRDVLLTGYSQAASLTVSSTELDFGTQFTNGLRLPRYIYLSNASVAPASHSAASLPAGSPFKVVDRCPTVIPAASACRIRVDYLSTASPSTDSTTLALDAGLSVLISGKTLPPQTVTGSTLNPNLTVTPTTVTFGNAVAVTAVSSIGQTITISNSGTSPFALTLSVTGDFKDSTNCAAFLPAGQSCTVAITFTPSQPGLRQGLLSVTAGSGTAYVSLAGNATAILPANNGTLSSGSIAIGQPVIQFYKVIQAFASLTAISTGAFKTILVEDSGFGPGSPALGLFSTASTGSCHNCWIGIEFLPTALGAQSGTLTLQSTPTGSLYQVGLSGVGLPVSGLILTPLTQNFGTVPVHSVSSRQVFTLTNLISSGAAVSINPPTTVGDFILGATPASGSGCGGPLAYSASCSVEVAFAPTVIGSRAGTLTLSGAGVTVIADLTGSATTDPGIAIQPLSLTFAGVPGATSTTQVVSITNTSNATIVVGAATLSAPSFQAASSCNTLPAGATCSISVTFLPGTGMAVDALHFSVTSTTGTPVTSNYTVAVNGNYTSSTAGIEIVPDAIQVGPIPVGQQSAPRLLNVSNLTAKSISLNVILPRQYVLVGMPCVALAPNSSCNFAVSFAPLTSGDIPGTIYAAGTPSDGSRPVSGIGYIEGYGIGTGTLTITGGLLVGGVFNFGQVTSGLASSHVFTLSNLNSPASPAITIRRVTSQPPFLSSTTCGSSLHTGESCTITVTYTPSNQVSTGTLNPTPTPDAGALVIESDAVSAPDTIFLSGQAAAISLAVPTTSGPLATFALSQSSLTFPVTPVGNTSSPQTITLSNTGTVSIHISAVTATSEFAVQSNCGNLLIGAACTISVSAVPQVSGIRIASLQITSDAATSLEFVSLIATAAPSTLTLSPTPLDFGAVLLGTSTSQTVQVSNTGGAPVVFGAIAITGDYIAASTCPSVGLSLAANTGCTIDVTFRPSASGSRTGFLSVATTASTNPLTVALSGVGTQTQLLTGASALAFGNVLLGSSNNASLTLLNSGLSPISNLAFVATGDFTVSIPCPQTSLAPGSSCAVGLTFTPKALATRFGTLSILSSDPASPISIPLSGIGIQGGTFAITVNGGTVGTATVVSGTPATYSLAAAPAGGFTGSVALTCTPIIAAQFATCSILPSNLTLASGVQTSVVTINTITAVGPSAKLDAPTRALQTAFACLLFPGLLTVWKGRRQLRRRRMLLLALLFTACSMFTLGCANGGQFNTLYTPPGTYQYQVTASSTSGSPQTQSVTLNLIVTGR